MRRGRCRYAAPWNSCNNHEGSEHHAEALMTDNEALFERLMQDFLPPKDIEMARWWHDHTGISWRTIVFDVVEYY